MNDKLKPCPFCGGKAEYHENCIDVEFGSEFWIRCTQCGCSFQTGDVNDTHDKVVEKWNRRVSESPAPRIHPLVQREIDKLNADMEKGAQG